MLATATAGALVTTAGTAAAEDNPWTRVDNGVIASRSAQQGDVRAELFAGFTLDRSAMAATLAGADTVEVVLPTPAGTFERFALVNTPVMEPGLAAKHPEIRTFTGRSVEDPTASVRADLTPLGFHASVRSQRGQWFVDPYSHRDQSLYASYFGHDLTPAAPLRETGVEYAAQRHRPTATTTSPVVSVRTYRLAIITDPSYARYVGAENVTAAKASLVNRIAQIYAEETAIRLLLVNDSDKTNLDTDALATGPNGPCGSAPCFRPDELEQCVTGTLGNAATVLGQLIGASNYEIGHVAMGVRGGGAGVPGVGGPDKAAGCTGITTPTGDYFAVDYVAHEMGHQFGAEHTFNGDQWGCGTGQRVAGSSYEPGSGVTIMSYAGICQQDNLQRHADPYFSHRSRTEITAFTTKTQWDVDEVQNTSLRDFGDGDSFTLTYDGRRSTPITYSGYGQEAIKAAVEAVLPPGGQVDVAGLGDNVNRPTPFDTTGFQVTFQGALAGVNVPPLGIDATGATGFVGETVKGGPQDNQGHRVDRTRNHPPVVTAAKRHTIPTRTPFALTGKASDADGDAVTYLWEQNDPGGENGTSLVDNTKTDGPLFRLFGTAAVVSDADALKYRSPGENAVTTDPRRVFPDLAQIAAGRTNAATGACPVAPPPPAPETGGGTNVPADVVDCYSEFLPTTDWVGVDGSRTLHFRLTARDGRQGGGGIGSADTELVVAPTAGPFLVTSHASGASYRGGSRQRITWDVAGTAVAPVATSAVRITFSTDGGRTFPHVLSSRTRNDGAETVTLPGVRTDKGRIRVEAVGNVFFDLNDADLTVTG
ncbi:M12 family metallo-peptidase [Umezawaea endophytica]|uniref:M12 family metallo-peptidase n=1 Tax=Umezawaea endophytica TaxID=1654476 RepID=A0A9X2VI13_9PSEU|nr:M12 family metallo-peptidase [Umezawaea endophytica]MCS7477036.1 M12 family metallo-peptidase [Umezawaea endophytica]